MPTDADLALRILLAALLGAVIGLERELTGQSAGLRTHITIALGAALFAIASAYSFTEFIRPREDTNYQVDVTRIASNIVTGVGFLGGGAIIKHGASVSGLTTAASIWVTAAVGLAVGLGSFFPAAATTVVLVFVLTALRRPRRWLHRRAVSKQTVSIEVTQEANAGDIVNALFALEGVSVKSVSVNDAMPDRKTIRAEVKGNELQARLAQLAEREDVTDVDVG
ncbi:MAG TPA: MgtC/SapB family protein [Actinomycetota bacterium]|nr:MgtC/SapB family protein [Actinomycetota bacterium]